MKFGSIQNLRQMNIQKGGEILTGESKFFIRDVINEDPAQTLQMGSVHPKCSCLRMELNERT